MDPILLIHGFPLDHRMWDAQATHLRQAGHTVLTPDLPGFGQIPAFPAPPPEHSSIESMAEFVHDIIQQQAGGRAIVGGFSMGGYILLALLRDYGSSVSAALFIDTRPEADSPEARAARVQSIEDIRKSGTGKLVETMTTRLLRKNPDPAVRQLAQSYMSDQSAPAVIAAQNAMAKRRDQTQLLPTLTLPALIVVGEEDAITPPAVAQAMKTAIPNAALAVIPQAGHLTPMEQPAVVNQAIADFLASRK